MPSKLACLNSNLQFRYRRVDNDRLDYKLNPLHVPDDSRSDHVRAGSGEEEE